MDTVTNPNPILGGQTSLGKIARSLALGEPYYIGAYAELINAANWAAAARLKEVAAAAIEKELENIRDSYLHCAIKHGKK